VSRDDARRGARRARRAAAARLALAALAAPACARYAPAAPAAVPEGARVRVALTAAGTAALARTPLGAGVVGIEGAWAGSRGDTVRVRADRLLTSAGVPVAWTGPGGEVALLPGDVRDVERRRADRGRTAAVVAGVAAAGLAFLAVIRSTGRNGGGEGPGGPTPF
jgi:hypothetical protein